jgi:3-oxoacyl-[acyl-carrier-protein] synthase II
MLALGEAYRIIRREHADFMLTGAADSKVNPLSLVRQNLFAQLSRRNDAPSEACRPFDRTRDGWVIGEGAGMLALEDLDHARRRHAPILAEIVGFGCAFDRDRSGDGIARAIRAALDGIDPAEVDHVNAHGLSTTESDAWEARGIRTALGDVPVFAPKSYFGSLSAAGGPAELIVSVLAMKHGVVPGTLNYREPDPACPVLVSREPRPMRKSLAVKLSLTDAGQVAAAVLRRWEDSP